MRLAVFLAVILLLGAAGASPAAAADKLGVIMIHGKQGHAEQFEPYDAPLAAQGYLTARPTMCWSHDRIYDKTYPDCLAEIDAAADHLKARGATAIVVVGMSLGGNAVLAYGARRTGLKGIVAVAPAHAVEFMDRQADIAKSIEHARTLIAEGHGDAKAEFAETNTGVDFTVTTTPHIYLSFHGPSTIAVMPANAGKLTAPLLFISGTEDNSQRNAQHIFEEAPKNPLNRFVSVHSDHRGTVPAGREAVIEWLRELQSR
jgi:esterase/lipase